MKTPSREIIGEPRTIKRLALCALAALLTMASTGARAHEDRDGGRFYAQSNLVADLDGVAQLKDTNLVNAWGISFSPTSPFWISDNGSGLSTLYAVTNDASGGPHVAKQGLQVNIPGDGSVSGQVFNDNPSNFHGDAFIFVNEDGTISGWHGGPNAEVLVPGSSNNVYKGVTIATVSGGTFLLAANFRAGTVDVYDTNVTLVAQLQDANAPAGYAPFNVRALGSTIVVTFAKQDAFKHDDDAGPGRGLIDLLDLQHQKFYRFATGSAAGGHLKEINSPWGIAVSPGTFGEHGDELLIGNFGSGTIMAFDERGHFEGLLESGPHTPVAIDGLWALTFGNGGKAGVPGTLYFTAGPNGESDGLFGQLVPVPKHHGHDKDDDDDHDHDGKH